MFAFVKISIKYPYPILILIHRFGYYSWLIFLLVNSQLPSTNNFDNRFANILAALELWLSVYIWRALNARSTVPEAADETRHALKIFFFRVFFPNSGLWSPYEIHAECFIEIRYEKKKNRMCFVRISELWIFWTYKNKYM